MQEQNRMAKKKGVGGKGVEERGTYTHTAVFR